MNFTVYFLYLKNDDIIEVTLRKNDIISLKQEAIEYCRICLKDKIKQLYSLNDENIDIVKFKVGPRTFFVFREEYDKINRIVWDYYHSGRIWSFKNDNRKKEINENT